MFQYLFSLVCRCATAAANKGYSFFGIQFYGECWSSADAAQRLNIYGVSNKCVDTDYKAGCDKVNDKPCAGVAHVNFVYQIVSGEKSVLAKKEVQRKKRKKEGAVITNKGSQIRICDETRASCSLSNVLKYIQQNLRFSPSFQLCALAACKSPISVFI